MKYPPIPFSEIEIGKKLGEKSLGVRLSPLFSTPDIKMSRSTIRFSGLFRKPKKVLRKSQNDLEVFRRPEEEKHEKQGQKQLQKTQKTFKQNPKERPKRNNIIEGRKSLKNS